MNNNVECPKCGRSFPLNEWLVVGAVHVIFDCTGTSTTRQTTLAEITEENEMVVDDSQGEEE